MISAGDRPITPGGLHVLLVLLDHHRAAHGAGVLHPEAEADRADDDVDRDLVVRCTEIRPRTMPSIRSATRIAGKVSCTSATRMITASTRRRHSR
jgi:hypothetical protein